MALHWDRSRGRILTEEENAKEVEESAKAWAGIILGGLAWAISYFSLGGFDTPFQRVAVVTAIAAAISFGWKFADWFWGMVAFLILGAVTILFAYWIFLWVVGAT
jgi:hypothetical protein